MGQYALVFPSKSNWKRRIPIVTLVYLNSAFNPILYTLLSQSFRKKFHYVKFKLRRTYQLSRQKDFISNCVVNESIAAAAIQARRDSFDGELATVCNTTIDVKVETSLE